MAETISSVNTRSRITSDMVLSTAETRRRREMQAGTRCFWAQTVSNPGSISNGFLCVSAPRRFKSSVQFGGDDVEAAEYGHDVAQRVAADQFRKQRKVNVRRGPAAGTIGDFAAVADDVEA